MCIRDRVEGFLKNLRSEKGLPQRVKIRRNFSSVDAERIVTSSATVPAVLKYLMVNRKEGDFAKARPFLIEKAVTGCP